MDLRTPPNAESSDLTTAPGFLHCMKGLQDSDSYINSISREELDGVSDITGENVKSVFQVWSPRSPTDIDWPSIITEMT